MTINLYSLCIYSCVPNSFLSKPLGRTAMYSKF